jgi:cytochrome c556
MKRVLSFACIASFALAVSLAAQAPPVPAAPAKIVTEADYAATMKEVGQNNGVMTKSIKGDMPDEALKAAMRLETLFKNVHAYWVDKKVADATTAANTAITSLQAVQKALASKDMAAAEAARATVAAQCMACHTAHREKTPEGGWRMK